MKDTNNLRQKLMEAPSLDQFLSENQDSFNRDSVCELLNRLFQKRRISKATLAKQSGMSEVYLHQVFFRAAQSLPQPSFVPVLWPERVAGGNPGAFEAMRVCPALSQGQAGCHYPLRDSERNGFIWSKRQAVCGK